MVSTPAPPELLHWEPLLLWQPIICSLRNTLNPYYIMDIVALFTRIAEISPLAGAMLFFLSKVWNLLKQYLQQNMTLQEKHSAQMLVLQEKSITAQNNNADAIRLLVGSMDKLREYVADGKNEVLGEIKEFRTGKRNGTTRPLPTQPTPPAAAA